MTDDKLWTPDSPQELSTEEKAKIEEEIIKRAQKEHVPEILPSELEKITKALGKINDKYVGKDVTPQLKDQIEFDIQLSMANLGFEVQVTFNPLEKYQSPEVVIIRRLDFDLDEAGKFISELKKRGGYYGDFNWRYGW